MQVFLTKTLFFYYYYYYYFIILLIRYFLFTFHTHFFVTKKSPNVNNDGLNTNTGFSSNYLENHLMNLIKPTLLTTKTLILITYSESKNYFDFTNYNHIYTVLIGPNVLNPHIHKDNNRYDHYNILPTIQDNWNLSKLGSGEDLALTPLDKDLFILSH